MSEGHAETTTFETRSNKPFLYSINSILPSNKEAYILRLPNELLQKCLQHLVQGDVARNAGMKQPRAWRSSTPHHRFCASSRSVWASSVTCKRLSQLSKPLLYSDVIILAPSFLNDDEEIEALEDRVRRRLWQFYRSVTESPELMRYCKIIGVAFKQSTWLYCQAALRQSPSLQELTLEGSDLRFERLGNVLGNLRSLKVLILSGVQCHEPRAWHPTTAVQKQRANADSAALPSPVSLELPQHPGT